MPCKNRLSPRPVPDQKYRLISIRCKQSGFPPTLKLLLVDDFVTKGRTILAAAAVLSRAFPAAQIQAFAVVRTMGLVPELEIIRWPIEGEIRIVGGDAERDP